MERVVDVRDFELRAAFGTVGRCRVQILRGEDRTVVVLTQRSTDADDGKSLTNGAEQYADAVRDRYLPEFSGRPPFVQHYVDDTDEDWQGIQPGGLLLTSFGEHGAPHWAPVPVELQALLREHADPARGSLRAEEPRPQSTDCWAVVPATALPRPVALFRAPCMKAGLLRTLNRELQRSGQRACTCWYHEGDWHAAAAVAITALQAARGETDDLNDASAVAARAVDLMPRELAGSWTEAAAFALLTDPIVPSNNMTGYMNGQHRSEAMIDQHVEAVPVVLPSVDEMPAVARLLR